MNYPSFNKRSLLESSSVPVTVSIVAICDIRILVKKSEDGFLFPNVVFVPQKETTQDSASNLFYGISGHRLDSKKWFPIDIRSDPKREELETGKFAIDIGYMAIIDLPDLPLVGNGYSWVLVDFEKGNPPCRFVKDHDQLWESAFQMFDVLIR